MYPKSNLILFGFTQKEGLAGVYYGDRYSDQLDGHWQFLMEKHANPLFAKSDYSGGIAAGLDAIRNAILQTGNSSNAKKAKLAGNSTKERQQLWTQQQPITGN